MVTKVVTAADSQTGVGPFYTLTDTVASSFTLEAGAFLQASSSDAIRLSGIGAWTVVINGQVSTDSIANGAAIELLAGGAASKVTVGEDGSLRTGGDALGALYAARDVALINNGSIRNDTGNGVSFWGDNTSSMVNSGILIGPNAAIYVQDAGSFSLTNSGQIYGAIVLSNGITKFVNTGQITTNSDFGVFNSFVMFGTGNDIFDNKGVISGHVDLGHGLNKFTNAGAIEGADGNEYTVLGGEGDDILTNAKTGSISNAVLLGDGANSFTNAGTVGANSASESLFGGEQVDTVKNSGTLAGHVNLFGGNDVFTNTGFVDGVIDLGAGDDVFKGGNFSDAVRDGDGTDKIALGGGNDIFEAYGGEGDGKDGLMGNPAADEVDGGAGIDSYAGYFLIGGVRVNLDSVDHTSFGWGGNNSTVVFKSTATDSTGVYVDKIKGFENILGGSGTDVIFGSSAANSLIGLGDNDELWGFGGNDLISGGDGVDYIVGGLGADIIYGGTTGGANDRFVYESVKDSGLTKATRDEIMDFQDIADEDIDLVAIDANSTAEFDQAFLGLIFNGNFTGNAGELRIYQSATGWMVEGDVTGDAKADFSIAVRDIDHLITWDFDNFVL